MTSWFGTDGLMAAHASTSTQALCELAFSHGWHLGTASLHHATLADALHAGDPLWAHRIVRARAMGPEGVLAGPLAPRAAVGPDLTCFVVGTRTPVGEVTLRCDRAAEWGAATHMTVDHAIAAAQLLCERGCTLVEIHEDGSTFRLHAALPRTGLTGLLAPAQRPQLTSRTADIAWLVTWSDALRVWRALSDDAGVSGALQVSALDDSFAVIRVNRRAGAAALDGVFERTLAARILGTGERIPSDVARALSLRGSWGSSRV